MPSGAKTNRVIALKRKGGGGGKQNKNPQNNPQFLFGYGVFFRVFSPAVALKL